MDKRNMYHLRKGNLYIFKEADCWYRPTTRFEPTNHKEIEIIQNNILDRDPYRIKIETIFKDKLTNKCYRMVERVYFSDNYVEVDSIEQIKCEKFPIEFHKHLQARFVSSLK